MIYQMVSSCLTNLIYVDEYMQAWELLMDSIHELIKLDTDLILFSALFGEHFICLTHVFVILPLWLWTQIWTVRMPEINYKWVKISDI